MKPSEDNAQKSVPAFPLNDHLQLRSNLNYRYQAQALLVVGVLPHLLISNFHISCRLNPFFVVSGNIAQSLVNVIKST